MSKSPLIWPVRNPRVGQSVLADRRRDKSKGEVRRHNGVDLFVPAGTEVLSASAGTVIRVVDGRLSSEDSKKRAGLWIDIQSGDWIYRYLHLGDATVSAKDSVRQGQVIGHVALPNTSGLGDEPHLHFEIRRGSKIAYGSPVNPVPLFGGGNGQENV